MSPHEICSHGKLSRWPWWSRWPHVASWTDITRWAWWSLAALEAWRSRWSRDNPTTSTSWLRRR